MPPPKVQHLSNQATYQPDLPVTGKHAGAWVLSFAALVALIFYIVADTTPHGAIAHAWGTVGVIISSALMLGAALLLALAAMPRWLIVLFEVLIVLDILGTGFCAYMLETPAMMAFMVIAFAGWCMLLSRDTPKVAP